MLQNLLRRAALPVLLATGFIVVDVVVDRVFFGFEEPGLTHFVLIASMLLFSLAVLDRAQISRTQAEAALRQARDEMAARVDARTAQLLQINAALQAEAAERRRVEEVLRESEEKYRLLFQNMGKGFALYELLYDERDQPVDWRILEVNDAYSRSTGLPPDRVVGRRMSELFPAAIPEFLPRFAAVVATQDSSSFETVADAVGRYHRVMTFPAGEHRFANIVEDISERRQAEVELRKQAMVLAQLNDAVIVLDENQRITFWNTGAEKLYGHRASDVLGRTSAHFPEPLFVGITRAELARQMEEQGEVRVESIRQTKDGRQVWIESRAVMLDGNASEPGGSIWVDRDITPRKEAEETIHRVEADLILTAQERATLEERQRLARELHDSVSQALYGISLGVNSALAFLDVDRAKVLEALNYTLRLVHTGFTEMRALIFELRPESLESEGLVAALTKQIEALTARHDLELELSMCDEPDVTYVVKEAVYRIALEAVQNSVKHARADRLNVRLICTSDSFTLEVCDDGEGFDPLAAYPGHLGLYSMRERAQRIGGTLEIASAPDCGTQIRVLVPGPTGVN